MTHDAGAGPKVNKTETMRPKDACAREAAFETPKEAATPRETNRTTLKPETQR